MFLLPHIARTSNTPTAPTHFSTTTSTAIAERCTITTQLRRQPTPTSQQCSTSTIQPQGQPTSTSQSCITATIQTQPRPTPTSQPCSTPQPHCSHYPRPNTSSRHPSHNPPRHRCTSVQRTTTAKPPQQPRQHKHRAAYHHNQVTPAAPQLRHRTAPHQPQSTTSTQKSQDQQASIHKMGKHHACQHIDKRNHR